MVARTGRAASGGAASQDAGAGGASSNSQFDEGRFRTEMQRVDIATELFHPWTHANWEDGRTRVVRQDLAEVRTQVSGARLQAADPSREDPTRERETQADAVNLVKSLRRLRAQDGLGTLVLSGEAIRSRQPLPGGGARVKFGLSNDPKEKFATEETAAGQSHRAMRRTIRRAGLRVEEPKEKFDPKTGFAGLEEWSSQLVLKQGWRPPKWLLLLPLLLLLLLVDCEGPDTILGMPIETDNLIVVLDKSGSMRDLFPVVRSEVEKTLDRMQNGMFRTCHVDLIVFDAEAKSALGGLTEVSDETAKKLDDFIVRLQADGGTRIRPALDIAAREIQKLGEPTTVVIFTDGEGDGSLQEIVGQAKDTVFKDLGEDIEIIGHTLTPRQLTPEGRRVPEPVSPAETNLQSLAHELGGQFGPLGEKP